jgi:hypothetical protein
MCDYSLHHVKSRPANVGDKLTTRNFNTGTRGFASPDDRTTAVCILPGTELAFSKDVKWAPFSLLNWRVKVIESRTAIFRQVNTDIPRVHHDALEFADGTCVLLTDLLDGQEATVLQLRHSQKRQPRKQPRGASPRWASVRRSRAVEIFDGSASSRLRPAVRSAAFSGRRGGRSHLCGGARDPLAVTTGNRRRRAFAGEEASNTPDTRPCSRQLSNTASRHLK